MHVRFNGYVSVLVAQAHHKLCDLLHVDDVLGIICVGVDDLGAAHHLCV